MSESAIAAIASGEVLSEEAVAQFEDRDEREAARQFQASGPKFEPSEFCVTAYLAIHIYVTTYYGGGFVAKCPGLVNYEEFGQTMDDAARKLADRIGATHGDVLFDVTEATP